MSSEAAALLALRDDVLRRSPFERANRIGAALAGRALGGLTLAQRDALLLRAREALADSRLGAAAECPRCGSALEFELDPALLAPLDENAPRERTVTAGGTTVTVRPPSIDDVAAALRAADPVRALAERCTGVAVDDAAALDAIDAALESLDLRPYRAMEIACAVCAHRWETSLDVGAYLWSEIDDWAVRLLLDVDLLARAYGWSEAEIVALGPQRRADYVALARR